MLNDPMVEGIVPVHKEQSNTPNQSIKHSQSGTYKCSPARQFWFNSRKPNLSNDPKVEGIVPNWPYIPHTIKDYSSTHLLDNSDTKT